MGVGCMKIYGLVKDRIFARLTLHGFNELAIKINVYGALDILFSYSMKINWTETKCSSLNRGYLE